MGVFAVVCLEKVEILWGWKQERAWTLKNLFMCTLVMEWKGNKSNVVMILWEMTYSTGSY